MLEAFFIFGYREFYKKMLCILVKRNKTIYGKNGPVPLNIMKRFVLNSPAMINHMIWQIKATPSVFPQSYHIVITNEEYIVHYSITQPDQFSLGRLPTMSSINQTPGIGWDRVNVE
jgi:hypothetical protein